MLNSKRYRVWPGSLLGENESAFHSQELVEESDAGLLMVTHSSRLAARMDRQLHLTAGLIS